jgi:poly-gamma-glutamate synthesis protein (capsule biosynthesis protein)
MRNAMRICPVRRVWLGIVISVVALQAFPGHAQHPARPGPGLTQAFRFAAVGDALVTMRFSMFQEQGFLDMVRLIRESDAAFANLEMLFHEFEGPGAAESGGTWVGADPAVAEDLKWAGFDLMGLANNHTGDYGAYGVGRTIEVLDRLGLVHAGVGMTLGEARRAAYLDTPNGRVALVSCASTFVSHSRAGHARPDVPGRPGLSALRHQRTYKVDDDRFKDLGRVAASLGLPNPSPGPDGGFTLFGTRFKVAGANGVEWLANENDVREILQAVREARRQADFVAVAIHSHEPGNASREPAPFVPSFARAAIDAGADVFLGSGPHRLRGIEIYKGRPIFYSLGDFFFQNDAVQRLPADFFEQYGLPADATVADAFDARDASPRAFAHTRANFESVVAISHYEGSRLAEVRLHPVTLGYDEPRSRRGRPRLAGVEDGRRIIEELAELSRGFGTKVEYRDGVGVIEVARRSGSAPQ